MGLDLTIAKTNNKLNLCELVSVHDAISENIDWCLGYKKEHKYSKYLELTAKVFSLSKKDVVESVKDNELKEYFVFIPNETFDGYLEKIKHTIVDFNASDSHVHFAFEKLPFVSLDDSCSWTLHRIFKECKAKDIEIPGQGDSIVELDRDELIELGNKWRKNSFKMSLARWVGYFKPEIGYRIVNDVSRDLIDNSNEYEVRDLIYFKNVIMKVCNSVNKSKDDDRFWMISSY